MSSKDATEEPLGTVGVVCVPAERGILCSLRGILFPIVHLLQKLFCLFFIDER